MPLEFYVEDISGGEVNPYEAIISASREARRINRTRLMVDHPEGQEKVTTIAMRRLAENKLQIQYGEGAEDEDAGDMEDDASKEQADSAGS